MSEKWSLILASSSPRRKEMMGHLNIPFSVKVCPVEEVSEAKKPADFALEIANKKGKAVFEQLDHRSCLVVSADTIVVRDQVILGKPKDVEEAKEFLKSLSARKHHVYTAVSLFSRHQNKVAELSFFERSEVGFATITDELMENYLKTGDSLDKAGAYGIQGPSLTFINYLNGCYANVVGFPLNRFIRETQTFLQKNYGVTGSWSTLF